MMFTINTIRNGHNCSLKINNVIGQTKVFNAIFWVYKSNKDESIVSEAITVRQKNRIIIE